MKIKGAKSPITYKELKSLLVKEKTLTIQQEKWYKNINLGYISIKEELYTIIATENKRKLIYDKNNILVDTKPFILEENKILNN